MQRGRDPAVAHLQQDLGDARDAGGRFEMTDVGFHRAQRTDLPGKLPTAGGTTEGPGQSRDLDRVSQRGPGAVRLDIVDGARIQARARQRLLDQVRLRARIRDGVTIGLAAVVQRRRLDDGMDVVAVRDGPVEGFQQDRADTLARHIPIAALAETATAPVARGKAAGTQEHVLVRMQGRVHAARDREFGFSSPQAHAGEMDGRQRRRAHGIERDARPVPIEDIRHAIGDRGIGGTQRIHPPLFGITGAIELILTVHDADEDADLPTGQGATAITGLLHRPPDGLQEEPFLGIERVGLARQNVEETRVEPFDPVEKTAPFVDRLARATRFGIEEEPIVPAFAWNLLDTIPALAQHLPELLQIIGLGVAAEDADDGDVPGVVRTLRRRRRGTLGTGIDLEVLRSSAR